MDQRRILSEPEWVELKKSHNKTCAGCGRHDWCSVGALPETGEEVFLCKRDPEPTDENRSFSYGAFLADGTKLPGTVLDYRLGRVKDLPDNWIPPPPKPKVRPPAKASAEDLDVVYRWLIHKRQPATGNEGAARELESRGLDPSGYGVGPSEEFILKALGTAAVAEHGEKLLRKIPGFYRGEDGGRWQLAWCCDGILIPCRDIEGRIVALKVRMPDGRKFYLSSAKHGGPGPGAPVHVPKFPRPEHDGYQTIRLTEGELKADEATMRSGILTISSPGVSSWSAALKIIRQLVPKETRVILAYDVDTEDNAHVAAATAKAANGIFGAGYHLDVETWDIAHGKGIDDLLRAGKQPTLLPWPAARDHVRGLLEDAGITNIPEHLQLKDAPEAESVPEVMPIMVTPYKFGEDHQTYLLTGDDDNPEKPIANFVPQVTREIEIRDADNPSAVRRVYAVSLASRSAQGTTLELTAEEYRGADSAWLSRLPGAMKITDARRSTRDYLLGAMWNLGYTAETVHDVQYRHTGWVRHDGQDVFVGPQVSIGPTGPVEGVRLSEDAASIQTLAEMDLRTDAPARTEDAWKLLSVADPVTAATGLGWVFRSLLDRQAAPLWVAGQQQSGKTFLVMTLLGFVGHRGLSTGGTDASSTLVGVSNLMDTRRHMPTFVDDVWKVGQKQRQDRTVLADQIMRAQYDGTFAAKGNRDGTLRKNTPRARGSLVVTAETPPPNDGPGGASLRSRTLVLNVRPGMIDCKGPESLESIQDELRVTGRLAAVGASFIQWVARQRGALLEESRVWTRAWMEANGASIRDARTAMAVADAAFGLELLARWTEEMGGTPPPGTDGLMAQALQICAEDSAASQAEASPAEGFRRVMASALMSGVFRMGGQGGAELMAENYAAWGIGRCDDKTNLTHGYAVNHDTHGQVLFFPGDFGIVESKLEEHARRAGMGLPARGRLLRSMLEDGGLLVTDRGRKTATVKINGKSIRGTMVLWGSDSF